MTDSSEGTSLKTWHNAVKNVDRETMLPVGLGNKSDKANILAFYGDKRINAAVALTLQEMTGSDRGVRWLTKVTNEAVSNELFASRLKDTLPVQSKDLHHKVKLQEHDSGTMVEAAVEAVASTQADGDDAVSDLANWLVEVALQRGNTNSKGLLLEKRGDIVSTDKLVGQPDHKPVFLAKAKLGDTQCEAKAGSKIEAQQAASAKVLELFGEERRLFPTNTRLQFDKDEKDKNDFFEITLDAAMNVKDGEDAKGWWERGAFKPKKCFHRTQMTPHAFADKVATVKCWLRQDSNSEVFSALVVVVATASFEGSGKEPVLGRSFLKHGGSRTAALKAVGLEANDFIANEILGLPR